MDVFKIIYRDRKINAKGFTYIVATDAQHAKKKFFKMVHPKDTLSLLKVYENNAMT